MLTRFRARTLSLSLSRKHILTQVTHPSKSLHIEALKYQSNPNPRLELLEESLARDAVDSPSV